MDGSEIKRIVGLIPISVENTGDEIKFEFLNGSTARLYHNQDCCESVCVEDVVGDLKDLIGNVILEAYEENGETPADSTKTFKEYESYTWTFYRIRTIQGTVVIRFLGGSNGCYSESVSFEMEA